MMIRFVSHVPFGEQNCTTYTPFAQVGDVNEIGDMGQLTIPVYITAPVLL